MMKEKKEYEQILQQILSRYDLSRQGEIDRAYDSCVEYARNHLLEDPNCNAFLQLAAQRLETVPYHLDTIVLTTSMPETARLDVYVSDENEVVLSGNDEGFEYLMELVRRLRDTEGDDHFHLVPGETALTKRSWPTVVYREETSWFDQQEEEASEASPPEDRRDLSAKDVTAVQFWNSPPAHLKLASRKLYKARAVVEDDGRAESWEKVLEGGEASRFCSFDISNDVGRWVRVRLHLDDPDVQFFRRSDLVGLI